jgi:AcrR family transcriptional regulator
METSVKRNYSSTLREAQARQTRRAIVEAGSRLFVADGFGRTTVDAIAEAAGVSRKTVFTSVGGKAEILKLAIDWAIVGDDEPVPLSRRPEVERLKRETDPHALVAGWVEMGVPISARVSGLFSALNVAAGIDDEARALLESTQASRMSGARGFCRALASIGGLRDGLRVEEATDIAWVHADPHLYRSLVLERGWSTRRFKEWLKESMYRQLLA